MPTVLSVFPNILNTILTILSALYLFHTFAKAKRKPIFVLFLVLSVFALSGVIWFTKIKQLRFVLMFAVVFLLSFSFKMKLLHRVLLTAASAALSGISDVIALLSQMLLFDVSSRTNLQRAKLLVRRHTDFCPSVHCAFYYSSRSSSFIYQHLQ